MALSSGTKLGPYEIVSPLGAGGMGEVYRARDTKLNREVALKVLPEAFASDPQRMARFEREAQVLASLNHPNIAAIYGLEESGSTRALVMELVEGETLAERLASRPLTGPASRDTLSPPAGRGQRVSDSQPSPSGRGWPAGPGEGFDDALSIAKQVAEALEYAHERGVVHRDLKPANIKITPEGTVKVLDFGLAKAMGPDEISRDVSNSPTLSVAMTQAGFIIGTAAYMAPEQAKAKPTDRRADIWAFGCLLFEMLTRQKPFDGETVTDVLAAVIKSEPDWTALPADTPASIQRLIRRCLVKDPKQRLRDIGEARITIEEALSGDSSAVTQPALPLPGASPRHRVLPWILAVVLMGLAGIAGWWLGSRTTNSNLNWIGNRLPGPQVAFGPRVSPDGRLVAFRALVDDLTQVAVEDPRSGNWNVLTHNRNEGLIDSLAWSPDGSKIYYDRLNPEPSGIYSVPVLGGDERLVLANAAFPVPLQDGSMLVVRIDAARRGQIYHYWPESGRLEPLNAFPYGRPIPLLRAFPNGKELVFWGAVGDNDSGKTYILNLATGNARPFAPALTTGTPEEFRAVAITPDGKYLLGSSEAGDLYRVMSIPVSGRGSARTLLDLTSYPLSMDVASDGSIYVDQEQRTLQIVRFPATGGPAEVLASGSPEHSYGTGSPLEFSDGRILLPENISGRARLLIGKPGGSFVSLLETDEEVSPLAARVGQDEVACIVGSGPARTLTLVSVKDGRIVRRFDDTKGKSVNALAVSPDGKTLYYVSQGKVWAVPSQGGASRRICDGDGVAVDPNGRDLIVNLFGQAQISLERVPLSGGAGQPIKMSGGIPLSPVPLSPNAIKDGKLLLSVEPTDSWFFDAAILDLATGRMTRIPVNYNGDVDYLSWSNDGRVLVTGNPIVAHIWRFRRVENGKK